MNTQEKIEQRRKEAAKAQKLNKQRAKTVFNDIFWKKVLGVVVVILLVAGIAALTVPKMGWTRRAAVAFTVGDQKVSAAEYSYYYRSTYMNYYQTMVNYLGEDNLPIDTSVPLTEQYMSTDVTYADYFSTSAIQSVQTMITLEQAAKEAGFELSEEDMAQYESGIAGIQSYASYYGMTTDRYLQANYGLGFNEKLFEKVLMREVVANAYQTAKMEEIAAGYNDEILENYYQENRTDFDKADFRVVQFTSGTDKTVEQAKKEADEFASRCTSEAAYEKEATIKLTAEAEEGVEVAANKSLFTNTDFTAAKAMDANVAAYIFDTARKVGDMEVVESTSGLNYYVVYIVSPAARSDQKFVDVRHILLSCDTTDEEALAQVQEQMDQIVADFEAAGSTEEAFAELANTMSEDPGSNTNGGLYENLEPGTTVQEFNDWCFNQNHKVGDTGVVTTEYGLHFMYLAGIGDDVWKSDISEQMQSDDYAAWLADFMLNYEVVTKDFGMSLRDEGR